MPTVEVIASVLASRTLSGLQGLKEDLSFDAKRAPGWDLSTEAGRVELAKDVSSFANADGGYIIVGLTTTDLPAERTEQVNGLALVTQASFNRGAIEGVLKDYLYPRIQNLNVTWVEDVASNGEGVGVILIPQMEHDNKFVLIKKVLDSNEPLKQIVFGIAVRHGSNSDPFAVVDLHRMCQEGRSSVHERLTSIEAKLDSMIRARDAQGVEPQAYAEQARKRVMRIVGNE